MTSPIRLPLSIKAHEEAIGITDAAGRLVAYVYFDDGCEVRRSAGKRFDKSEAVEIARKIARALSETEKPED